MNCKTLLYLSKRAVASAVVALAMLMTTQSVEAGPKDAVKDEVMLDAQEPVKEQSRKTLGEDRSTGPIELLVLEKKAESRKKLDVQIVQLKELLKFTPKEDPRRAELLFNLAEAYWEKSKSYSQEVFVVQDECYALRDKGDAKGEKRCLQMMEDIQAESNRLREESVALYVDIISNPVYSGFAQKDSALYYLGANLQEIGKKEQALGVFTSLLNEYQDSQYIPNVLLAMGDYYFDEGDIEVALNYFEQVVEGYSKSSVYTYALYKSAWCYFNLDQKEKALDTFLKVIKAAQKDKKSGTAAGLLNQTRKDIVMTYSFIGSPSHAIGFFKKISKDDWLGLAERLAVLYSDKGRSDESTAMYQALIRSDPSSWKIVEYQYEIVRNTMLHKMYSEQVVVQMVDLLRLVQRGDEGKFKLMDEKGFKEIREKVETFVRSNASLFHREAQTTKNDALYGMAYHLYRAYLETFPNGPKSYQMTFFYAELLYRVEKWKEAAQMYERALEIEPEGRYTNEAVHGLVLSYFKLVETSEKTRDLNESANRMMESAVQDDAKSKPKEAAIPQPKELPDLEKKLIEACKLYIKLNPDGKEIVDVKYTMARRLYDFDHLREAIPLFKDIAYSYPNNDLGKISANLHLDSLNLLRDYDGIEKEVSEYMSKKPIKDQDFMDDLVTLGSSVKFMRCTVFEENEKWREGAQCFVDFYRSFPESEHVDKALYNAALDFERMKNLDNAIKVREFLVGKFPNSELAQKSLYNIGANYHALAIYSESAKRYEDYSAKYPNGEGARDALANASTFRQGLGEYDQAIVDYQNYLKRYGKNDPQKVADVNFQIAKTLQAKGDKEAAYEHYRNYLRRHAKKGTQDQFLEASLENALYLYSFRNDQKRWKDGYKALKQFKNIVKHYDKMSQKSKDELTTGLDAVAQAQFMIAENLYDQMARMDIQSKNEKELLKKLNAKSDAAKEVADIYQTVVQYKRPDWAIAALYRTGNVYENFANSVRKSTVPRRLTYDQKEIYRGVLEDHASVIENKAVEAYKLALQTATQAAWFNDYSEKSEQALSQLRPREYRTPSEKRARPENFFNGLERAKYIKDVEDADRLEDLNTAESETAPSAEAAEGTPN